MDERDDNEDSSDRFPVKVNRVTGGRWNPLASFRKTISPEERLELLRLQPPLLPPEDFMDTAELQRVRYARLRRWWPGLTIACFFAIALVAVILLWPRAQSQPEETSTNSKQPETTPRVAQAAALPTTGPSVASAPIVAPPASGSALPLTASAPPIVTTAPHATSVSSPPKATTAASTKPSTPKLPQSSNPDFKTPW